MNFLIHSCCERGGREKNEDALAIKEDREKICLIVADGLGGHHYGEEASQQAVKVLSEGFFNCPDLEKEALENLFCEANQSICSLHTETKKMKSTVAALFYHDEKVAIGYMGDTRVYRFSGGKIIFQTEDHSVSQMAVYAQEITKEQVRFHVDRNIILRALGSGSKAEIIAIEPLIHGDVFLICTDGFWEYITEEMMEKELLQASTPKEWLEKMCATIQCHVDDGSDNYSAIAMFCMED